VAGTLTGGKPHVTNWGRSSGRGNPRGEGDNCTGGGGGASSKVDYLGRLRVRQENEVELLAEESQKRTDFNIFSSDGRFGTLGDWTEV